VTTLAQAIIIAHLFNHILLLAAFLASTLSLQIIIFNTEDILFKALQWLLGALDIKILAPMYTWHLHVVFVLAVAST